VSELRVDRDLEQEIAELLAQPLEITGIERLERFVRLFKEMRAQRRMGLLAVPRASVWRAQAIGEATDSGDRREIHVRIHRRKDDEAGIERRDGLERDSALSRRRDRDERMERWVVLPQQRDVGRYIDDEDDRA